MLVRCYSHNITLVAILKVLVNFIKCQRLTSRLIDSSGNFCAKKSPATFLDGQKLHTRHKRIVGGNVSVDGAWPWQVALFLDGLQVCGGSLIDDEWIVTACHCFKGYHSSEDPRRWKVKLGSRQAEFMATRFEQTRKIVQIIFHPDYFGEIENGVLARPPDYDIALLRLSKPVKYNSFVQPVCLAAEDDSFPQGKTCYITGWGTTGWGKPQSKFLEQASIRLISGKDCNEQKSYNGIVPHTSLCAGVQNGKIDSCQKDSGGPLSCEHNGNWYLVGVTSWGWRCALPNKYGVYTDVRVLHDWIIAVVNHQ
ncbi:serine protease 41-like isoform X2 [Acropora millepora]|uniref:serine protease 41-like isoform X2 n=1 Tax=Acropora millepora TaxID=45264 RepID=UPI0010FCC60A|nr:serine protease 41-like isoform X2 [Acropora millepora]